jgi:distribution and morphology protein 31
MSSKPDGESTKSTPAPSKPETAEKSTGSPSQEPPAGDPESLANSMSKYLHLPHLPKMHMPHRPTKEELLAAASGFWERLKVRFKWFSIRSMRPWNADEWGAFVSWFLFGHLVWILVGTTTFFSLVIFTINTVFAQGEFLSGLRVRDVQ